MPVRIEQKGIRRPVGSPKYVQQKRVIAAPNKNGTDEEDEDDKNAIYITQDIYQQPVRYNDAPVKRKKSKSNS